MREAPPVVAIVVQGYRLDLMLGQTVKANSIKFSVDRRSLAAIH